jgi:uncharacterized protein
MHNGSLDTQTAYRNWRTRIIASLTNFVTRAPKTVVICAVLLSLISAWYAAKNLTLDANTDSLISPDRAFMQKYTAYCKEFGDLEYLYVAVDAKGNPAAAKAAVDELKLGLESLADLPGVYARIDGDEQWRLAPRAMSTTELKSLLTASDGFQPLLATAESSSNAFTVLSAADERLQRLMSNGLSMSVEERQRIGAGAALLMSAVSAQSDDGFAFAHERKSEYLVSSSGNMFFIEILPQKDFSGLGTIEPVLTKIRGVISQVQSHSPAVDIGLTGKPVLQADELLTTNQDMTRGTLIAAILVMIFTMWTFGSLVRPILACVVLAMTFACTYGTATLLVGRLNLLSLVFMLVLVSAGVDYGIHTIARYTEFRGKLGTFQAMRSGMEANTNPTWVGAFTSAAVFFIALGTEFGGLRELGIIAGSGLVICALMMTTVLPALIILVDGWREIRAKDRGVSESVISLPADVQPSSPSRKRPTRILICCGIATIALCSLIPLMRFESNLLKLQADGLESIQWEHRILEDSLSASWFGAVICRTEAQVTSTVERAHAQPLVAEVRSVLDLVQPDSAERIKLRAELAMALLPSTAATVGGSLKANPVQQQELTGAFVESVRKRLGQMLVLASLQPKPEELAPLRKIAEALTQLERKLNDPQLRMVAQAQAQEMVEHTGNALKQMGVGANAGLRESLPLAVRARFVSPEGGMLVSIFPKIDLWEFAALESFVKTLRTIDPEATGAPMTVFESIVDMRDAFILMSTWSALAITLLVWLDLRSVVSTATCIACLFIGMSWTFGLLGLLGVSLNLANFFSVPMLLGFGIDSCVHVMHRAREQENSHALGWTMRAVILSAVTTAVGFGTLLFASHRGLQSLGLIMFIGSFSCLICAVTLLPAALRIFPRLTGSDGKNTRKV